MQHIDQELLAWLFIGAAGLILGVYAIWRSVKNRSSLDELKRLGTSRRNSAGGRRERIAARPQATTVESAPTSEPVKPRQPEAGPGRPSVLVFAFADGRQMLLQRASEIECRDAEPRRKLSKDEGAAMFERLCELAGVLQWDAELGLCREGYSVCVSDLPLCGEGDAPRSIKALDASAKQMGDELAGEEFLGLGQFVRALESKLRAPDAALLYDFERTRTAAAQALGEVRFRKLPSAAEWDEVESEFNRLCEALFSEPQAAKINELSRANETPDASLEIDLEALAERIFARLERLHIEVIQLPQSFDGVEALETAVAKAADLLLEQRAAALMLRSAAAACVIARADFGREIHAASLIGRSEDDFPEIGRIAEAAQALAIDSLSEQGRHLTPEELERLRRVRVNAEALQVKLKDSVEELSGGANALELAMDRRALGASEIKRFLLYVREGEVFLARPI